jgi:VWFA-related protein
MNRFLVLALVAPFLAGPGAAGQEPASRVRETAEVVVVEVPVRVTGRDGKPISNLTAADFELYDDGKKQTVIGLDAIDLAEKASAAPGQELNPAARRRFLLLFDLSFSRPRALLEARGAAKEFVLSGMGEADLAAVATFSLDAGLRLLINFSSDRVQLARAIDTLGLATSLAKEKDPLEIVYDVTMLRRITGSETGAGRAANAQDAALIESMETFQALGRAAQDRYARARIGRLFSSFDDLAAALDLVGGRKDIIYLSEGFESRLLVGTRDTEKEKEWITTGELWKIDSDRRFGSSAAQSQLDSMTTLFRRSDCVIHAVDLSGIRTDADISSVQPTRFDNSLFELAQGTGGDVFRNANNFRTNLEDLIRRTNLVYVLAFRPTRTGNEGRFHELKVKVHATGARVSARAGYYERKGFKQLSPLERSLAAADVIANEIPVSDIPVRALAAPFPTGEQRASVPVLLEIPGDRLLVDQKGDRLTAEIYIYASDSQNRLRDFLAQAVNVDLSHNREALLKGGVRYYGDLALAPGQYRLRILVRNAQTGRMGLTVVPIQVPDFAGRETYVLPPIFLETAEKGIFVRGRGKTLEGARSSAEYPLLEASNQNLVPVARPEVRPGQRSPISVVAYHFGSGEKDESLRIGAHVLAADGRPIQEGSLVLLSRSSTSVDGKQTLLLGFTPQGLGPGQYALRIFLQDSATGRSGYSSAPFVIP